MFETESVIEFFEIFTQQSIKYLTSPGFYAQLGMILLAIVIAYSIAALIKRSSPLFKDEPHTGKLLALRQKIFNASDLIFPLLNILALNIAVNVNESLVGSSWLIRVAEGLAIILLIYTAISRFISTNLIKSLVKWILIPIAVLEVFGWLEHVTSYLDTLDVTLGNIRISVYTLARVILFGTILFWLGRLSSTSGQRLIRSQQELHVGTREVLAKLFEVTVFLVIFLLLLQIMGISLTALAVFGGALGVGIGLGLQSIASNFVSGIIILLDRSVSIGDYVQVEEGVAGVVREMNMRSTVIETFDGKDIVVPNEKFINSNVVNWTHKDNKQRYSLTFQVAYKTDLDVLFDAVREVCRKHPKVLSGDDYPFEEQPDAEIQSFAESGITILVEFWIRGIDDGKNRVGADLLYGIWKALRENGIEIPFPQREVRVINDDLCVSNKN